VRAKKERDKRIDSKIKEVADRNLHFEKQWWGDAHEYYVV
jgi:hypothetical protein